MVLMAADPSTQAVWAGVIIAALSTIGGVAIAIVTNKKERGVAAESAMETTLRERIVLRDEQLAVKEQELAERDHEIDKLNEELQLYKDGRL